VLKQRSSLRFDSFFPRPTLPCHYYCTTVPLCETLHLDSSHRLTIFFSYSHHQPLYPALCSHSSIQAPTPLHPTSNSPSNPKTFPIQPASYVGLTSAAYAAMQHAENSCSPTTTQTPRTATYVRSCINEKGVRRKHPLYRVERRHDMSSSQVKTSTTHLTLTKSE
jgi:hypothetical protein